MSIRAPAGCSTVAVITMTGFGVLIAMTGFGVLIAMTRFGVLIAMTGFGVLIAMTGFGVLIAMTGFGVLITMTRFSVLITMTGFGMLVTVSALRMVITMTTTQAVPVVIRGTPTVQVIRRQLHTGRDVRAGHRDTRQTDLLQRKRIHRLSFAAQRCNTRMVEDTFGKRSDKARWGIHVKVGAVRQTGRMVGAGGETGERECANNLVDLHVTAAGLGSAKKGARMVRQNDQKRKAEDG
jgi:hypothetical protein